MLAISAGVICANIVDSAMSEFRAAIGAKSGTAEPAWTELFPAEALLIEIARTQVRS